MVSHAGQTNSHIEETGWGGVRVNIMSGLHWMTQIKDPEKQAGLTQLQAHAPLLTTQRAGILQRQNTLSHWGVTLPTVSKWFRVSKPSWGLAPWPSDRLAQLDWLTCLGVAQTHAREWLFLNVHGCFWTLSAPLSPPELLHARHIIRNFDRLNYKPVQHHTW